MVREQSSQQLNLEVDPAHSVPILKSRSDFLEDRRILESLQEVDITLLDDLQQSPYVLPSLPEPEPYEEFYTQPIDSVQVNPVPSTTLLQAPYLTSQSEEHTSNHIDNNHAERLKQLGSKFLAKKSKKDKKKREPSPELKFRS